MSGARNNLKTSWPQFTSSCYKLVTQLAHLVIFCSENGFLYLSQLNGQIFRGQIRQFLIFAQRFSLHADGWVWLWGLEHTQDEPSILFFSLVMTICESALPNIYF